ncbi:MAG TPA: dienelactone hydrolase family protein [Methylovirgula sp.]|nr:dienelactone hydrolase family protein [Methylovirgula sp.]
MRTFLLIILAVSAIEWAGQSRTSAEDLVKFESAASETGRGTFEIQGYLTKPRGKGPLPAVVLLHSCLGVPANRQALAKTIASWGYVVLFVDDFTTRGLKETCAVDFKEAGSDAFGALVYLSTLPYVDPSRIAAVGYSQGGDTALGIAASRYRGAFAISADLKFKAAAAFYPPCANLGSAALNIPTLILVGELDDVTPAADCSRLAANQPDVKLVVYPGAHHLFDDPSVAHGMRLLGMWLQYDAGSAVRAKVELRQFLSHELGR